jgi:hypothetical protein
VGLEETKSMFDGSNSFNEDWQEIKAVNVLATFRVWAEYFNSPLRCWEPLLEPFVGRCAPAGLPGAVSQLLTCHACPQGCPLKSAMIEGSESW